ncbi:MAG: hypothetical protein ACYCQI_02490 [Gammaproteobacteria bacterium]
MQRQDTFKQTNSVTFHGDEKSISDIMMTTTTNKIIHKLTLPQPPESQDMDQMENDSSMKCFEDTMNCFTDAATIGLALGAAATIIPLVCLELTGQADKNGYKKLSCVCFSCTTLFSLPGGAICATGLGIASCFTFPCVAYRGEPKFLSQCNENIEKFVNKRFAL